MNLEERRFQSFRRWPHADLPGPAAFLATPIKLAKSGFYHHPTPQYPDRVVCFCCGVALVHWNRHHDPWTEHCKRSPVCGFVTGAYSMYVSEERRRASFINWPLPGHYAANPDRLAKSGFIYAPSQSHIDRCVCFCCGIALVRWDPVDDPWTEHVKHSKACPFVRGAETGNVPLADAPQDEEVVIADSVLGQLLSQLDAANIDAASMASSYLLCPITQDLMCDPVFAEDGHTYERDAIKRWLETHNTSPLTNKVLYSKRLVPNHNLRSQLIEFAESLMSKSSEQNLGQSASGSAYSTFQLHTSASYLPPPPPAAAATAATSNPALESFVPAAAWDVAPPPPPPAAEDAFVPADSAAVTSQAAPSS